MARPRRTIAIATLSLGLPLLAGIDATAVSAAPRDLSSALAEIREKTGMPAIAAAAIRDGEIIGQGVVGVRALGDPAPARLEDAFLIGSCAKSMMRVLIGRLAERGVLAFGTTLAEALPDVPMRPEYRTVTLAQILEHRGGIPAYTMIGPKITPWLFELTGAPVEQRRAFASHVLQEEPAAAPGGEMVYSNAGFGLLAHVAETRAGKPWEQLLAEEVFRPLDLRTASIGLPTSEESPEGVRGHFHNDQGYELVDGWRRPLPAIAPSGMVSCSILDFARFCGALAAVTGDKPNPLLKDESAEQVRDLTPDGGEDGIVFFGGEGTFTAAFALWPSLGLAIVAETNGGESDHVCQATIEAVRAALVPEARPSPDLTEESEVAPVGGPGGPAGPGQPSGPRTGRLGIGLRAVDENLEVAMVAPDSPAAKAGVEENDRIEKINGKDVSAMNPDDRMAELRKDPVVLLLRRGSQALEITLRPTPAAPAPSSE